MSLLQTSKAFIHQPSSRQLLSPNANQRAFPMLQRDPVEHSHVFTAFPVSLPHDYFPTNESGLSYRHQHLQKPCSVCTHSHTWAKQWFYMLPFLLCLELIKLAGWLYVRLFLSSFTDFSPPLFSVNDFPK